MSYAQRHRSRLELQQTVIASAASSTGSTPLMQTPAHRAASALSLHAAQQSQRPPSMVTDGALQRSTSSLVRANAARLQQGHSSGIDIAAWSEAASNAGAGERQPFQLLQRTPPKNEPPRLKASRKHFASPHVSAATVAAAAAATNSSSEGNPSIPLNLPIVVNPDSPVAANRQEALPDPLATDLRTGQPAPAHATAPPQEDDTGLSQEQTDAHSDALAAGEMSPSPIPVSHQPSQPPVPFADSSVPSSARLSTSQWPASETFSARLKNIMDTRQQIEALVQKQRADEEEMVHAIAALDEQSALHLSQQEQPSSPESAASHGNAVRRHVYQQVVMERDAAFAALREFKEKGNVIVHHLYDTVKSQQEQALELVATVEALKKANKRLKDALSSSGGASNGNNIAGVARVEGSEAAAPGTVAQLQQKVATQRRVIEQMDQLMQNADRMLLAMRARVEAAERRAASATAPQLDRRQLPPLPKGGARSGPSNGEASLPTAAAAASPDAVGALERLSERYPADRDVATVAVQQQLLLDRIGQLRQSLKQEEAQRLHLEEVYGATSEETAKNVALLEERLQRAENPRGVPYSSGTATALRDELHTLLEQEGGRDERPPTPSNASSPASSRSSTPTRTLFTAVSVGDWLTNRVVDDVADDEEEEEEEEEEEAKAAPAAVEEIDAEAEEQEAEASGPTTPPTSDPASAVEGKKEELQLSEAKPRESKEQLQQEEEEEAEQQQQRQPRAFLGRQRSAGRHKGDAAAGPKAPLGIPVPDTSSLGNSLRRSANSRSSSASRRLVDFRSVAAAADATSRGLGSDEDVDVDVESDDDDAAAEAAESRRIAEKSTSSSNRAAGLTGVTPTVTPTAIHSASSPLPDTSTSAEMSARRQQRLHQQMEELDKLEADVTNVVRSLDVA